MPVSGPLLNNAFGKENRMTTAEDLANRFVKVSQEILTGSRNELYFDMHYLGLALSSLSFVASTDIDSFGTDGRSLVVHPKALADLFEKNRRLVNRVYLHEVYHCLFRHIFKPVRRSKTLWMLACDMAVEFLIDDGHFRSTRIAHSQYRSRLRAELEKRTPVLNAESIYRQLILMAPDREEAARMKAEFSVDDHSLWPSLNPENSNSPLPPAAMKLQNKWDDISKKTQTQMESFSTEMSQKDSDFLEQTKVENRKKYDYRSFLRKFAALREEMHVDPDTFDYVLYTFGLSHYGNMPLIEPQEFREVKKIDEFVIVIDVSMSVTGELVHAFLEQTYSILSESESYLHKVNIRILQCDEKVLSDEKITSQKDLKTYMEHFELKGQGGTDFRPAFDYVAGLIQKKEFRNLRGLLYFTDGKGIFPKKKPPYETAFIFCEESADDRQVPPWAMKLILPREDIEPEKDDLLDSSFVWPENQL